MIGEIVSFTFEKHRLLDIPSHPKVFRVRSDVSWEDVIYNSKKEKKYLNGMFTILHIKHLIDY